MSGTTISSSTRPHVHAHAGVGSHHHAHGGHSQAVEATRGYEPDEIRLSRDPMRMVRMAVNATNRSTEYQTPEALEAYVESLRMAKPTSSYDPNGFLGQLGLWGIRGAGRDDAAFRHAVRKARFTYDDHTILGGRSIPTQRFFRERLIYDPGFFGVVQSVADPVMAAPANIQHRWDKPFQPAQTPRPTDVPPTEHYRNAYAGIPTETIGVEWGSDFHGGVPGTHSHEHEQGYGTYTIAKTMGFSDDSARRLGMMANGVDEDTTPYGKTGPSPFGALDRHFNFNRDGEDTRIIWARRHLEEAIRLGRMGSYEEAEKELGTGLHSVQDLFAHAQVTPAVHAVLGRFVDSVGFSPVSMVEATIATRNYLRAYLKGIADPNGDYNLPPEPQG